MASINKVVKIFLLSLIRVYRLFLSALMGNCCRFEPSCSHYAMEAIDKHDCLKGLWFTMRRLLRCHPWHAGGSDPVPTFHETSILRAKGYWDNFINHFKSRLC